MLKEVKWSGSRAYATDSEHDPIEFYLNALSNSTSFDLLLGYFSSAAINVLSLGFTSFITNGGKMRIVANNILSEEDKLVIQIGTTGNIDPGLIDLSNVKDLRRRLDEYGVHFFECIAYLISVGRVEIKMIRPKAKMGISHYKDGIFSDGSDALGFSASCNFTAFGLLENFERLHAFLEWENGSKTRIQVIKDDFDRIFSGTDPNIEYLNADDIIVALKDEFGNKSEQELIVQSKNLVSKKKEKLNRKDLNHILSSIEAKLEKLAYSPHFPHGSKPREYQMDAYNNWVKKDHKGLFAMATGTGKTITALNCLLEEFKKTNSYHAIILVPSKALLEQWIEEVTQFNFTNLIVIGGGYDGMKLLPNFVSNFKAGLRKDVIIISTYASFSSDKFLKYFSKIQDDFILIADEAHNMGASQTKDAMSPLTIPKRIGLSATPNRKYDPEGTDSICEFFNDKTPFCYNFDMKRAMKEGRLTDYYYYPRIVHLDEDEKEEYVELSNALIKFFDFEQGKFRDSPIVERLLLRRKTIIHQARRKIPAFKEILKNLDQRGKLKYVFTYVPVGTSREEDVDNEDISNKFVYQYLKAAQEVKPELRASTYTSETEDRKSKIRGFSEGKIDMLLAMKMLDEGVDIPRTEVGIFASSTGNPREYIQRRGRLLRNHENKKFAYVYDMIVAPLANYDDENLYRIERNMVRNELIRVAYFASLSMNFYDSKDSLKDICDRYDLDLDTIINELEND